MTKFVSIKVSRKTLLRLRKHKEKTGVSINFLVDLAVKSFLDRKEGVKV